MKTKEKVGGGFNRREPTYTKRIHLQPPVLDIFKRHHWLGFFELLKGYDDDITYEFSMTLNYQIRVNATTMVRGLDISISPELISRVTTLPLGVQWRREEKTNNAISKNKFFTANENLIEDKNGVRRKSYHIPGMRWPTIS